MYIYIDMVFIQQFASESSDLALRSLSMNSNKQANCTVFTVERSGEQLVQEDCLAVEQAPD